MTVITSLEENVNIPVTLDALFARFIVCAPRAKAPKSDDFKPICLDIPSLMHFLFAVYALHRECRRYEYSAEAKEAIRFKFNQFSDIINAVNSANDTFLANVYGKSQIIVDRLAGVLHVALVASKVLCNCQPPIVYNVFSKETRQQIASEAKKLVREEKDIFIIHKTTAEKAIKLIDYYISQKKALCGYSTTTDLNEIQQEIRSNDSEESGTITKRSLENAMALVLITPGKQVSLTELVKHRKYPTKTFAAALEELEKLNIGKVVKKRNSRGSPSIVFHKHDVDRKNAAKLLELENKLKSLKITTYEYLRTFENSKLESNASTADQDVDENRENMEIGSQSLFQRGQRRTTNRPLAALTTQIVRVTSHSNRAQNEISRMSFGSDSFSDDQQDSVVLASGI
ncbi:unnamed protein product, partial [Didymodactylos carnosus]